MKFSKYILALGLLFTILTSCNKNDGQQPHPDLSETIITAKFDGSLIGFTGEAVRSSNPDGISLKIKGLSVNGFRTASIGLDILAATIGTGTYATVTNAGQSQIGSVIRFSPNVVTEGSYDSYSSAHAEGNGNVTITAISDKAVEGTFKGTLRLVDAKGDATGKVITVTDGNFKVQIRK